MNSNFSWLTWPMVGKVFSIFGSLTVCALVLGMNIQTVKSDVKNIKEEVVEVKSDLKDSAAKSAKNEDRITRVEEQVESFQEISRDIKSNVAEQREILIDLKSITHELKGRVEGQRGNGRRARSSNER